MGPRITTCECSCQVDQEFADGSKPEFFEKEALAVITFMKYKKERKLFWAVHLNGQHILKIDF